MISYITRYPTNVNLVKQLQMTFDVSCVSSYIRYHWCDHTANFANDLERSQQHGGAMHAAAKKKVLLDLWN